MIASKFKIPGDMANSSITTREIEEITRAIIRCQIIIARIGEIVKISTQRGTLTIRRTAAI